MAIDRDFITSNVLQSGQFPAYTFTPNAVVDFTPPKTDYAGISQKQRDTKARELLASAGYGADNPLSFTLLTNTSTGHIKIAAAITSMWKKKLGVNASIKQMAWKTFVKARQRQNFEMARSGWCGDYNEASAFLYLIQSKYQFNDGKYSNAKIDQLLAASKTISKPFSNYTKIERIIADEMPIIPIYHYSGVMMLSTAVKNWPINNGGEVWYSKNLYKIAN